MSSAEPQQYKVIANRFTFSKGKKDYMGVVVVSHDAFYLLRQMSTAAMSMGVLGGLVGGAIVGAAAGAGWLKGKKNAMECDVSELPADVMGDPNWPLKKAKGNVIVLPRESVTEIRYPWWGALGIKTESERFSVQPVFFKRKSVLSTLQELGWEISK